MGRGAEAAAARRQPPLCLEPRTVHWPSLKGVRRPPHHSRRRPQPRDRCTSSRRHRRRLRFCFLFETKRGGDAQRQQGGGAHSSQGIGKCVSSFRRLFLLAFCVYTCVSSSNYCVRINGCFRLSDEPRITARLRSGNDARSERRGFCSENKCCKCKREYLETCTNMCMKYRREIKARTKNYQLQRLLVRVIYVYIYIYVCNDWWSDEGRDKEKRGRLWGVWPERHK